MNVSRGAFYNHIFRRADRSKYEGEQAQLMKQVQQIFDDSGQGYGAEKIRVILAENGIHTSRKRISAIMQELDLYSVRTDSKKQFKKRQKYAKQDLLKQHFKADRPNEKMVTDITEFNLFGQKLYLSAMLDPHSRDIVSYTISDRPVLEIVTSMLEKAFLVIPDGTNLILHSDQG